jgi:hypothetical protein
MNCANHPAVSNVAFCRTCGKPLCANCTRDVQGVIYCETCLAQRLHGVQPQPAVSQQGINQTPVYVARSGPNAALAGILGAIPFGIGAIYNGQYAKGLAHLLIFVFLIWGEAETNSDAIHTVLGFAIAFFVIYQIIDAIQTAKAIQAGLPAPDPLGLGQAFGAAEPTAAQAGTAGYAPGTVAEPPKVPAAAVILIGLGVLFLLQTVGVFDFSVHRMWPLVLIGLGVWLLAKREGWVGSRYPQPHRRSSLMGPAVLITIGTLFLMESIDGPNFGHTWPVLLLVIGAVKLLEGKNPPPPPLPPMPGTGMSGAASAEQVSPPSSEVHNG